MPLWRVVQGHPSAATFPDGEGLAAMAARAAEAVHAWNARLGPDATYAVVSHGDVIKALIADALGLHLDGFQRIVVDPCSLSVVRYTELRPFVVRVNDTGGGMDALLPRPPSRRRRGGRAAAAILGRTLRSAAGQADSTRGERPARHRRPACRPGRDRLARRPRRQSARHRANRPRPR